MECFQSQNNLEAESDKESSTDTSESGRKCDPAFRVEVVFLLSKSLLSGVSVD